MQWIFKIITYPRLKIAVYSLILLLLIAYFIGSIPFGYIYSKKIVGIDIREMGSCCTGATNVLRNCNKCVALLTLMSDAIKGGVVAMIAVTNLTTPFALFVCFAGIVGHIYPVWLKFHGGKGVAISAGIYLYLMPLNAILAVVVWACTAKISKKSSIASIAFAASIAVFSTINVVNVHYTVFCYFIFIFLLFTHKDNLKRLMTHTENNIR